MTNSISLQGVASICLDSLIVKWLRTMTLICSIMELAFLPLFNAQHLERKTYRRMSWQYLFTNSDYIIIRCRKFLWSVFLVQQRNKRRCPEIDRKDPVLSTQNSSFQWERNLWNIFQRGFWTEEEGFYFWHAAEQDTQFKYCELQMVLSPYEKLYLWYCNSWIIASLLRQVSKTALTLGLLLSSTRFSSYSCFQTRCHIYNLLPP